jgi:hypothetical protein
MTNKNNIIGIVGWAGSGKDTAANFLVKNHGYKRASFANTLKDAVASIFHWPRNLLEGDTAESREWREQVDTWWAERLGIPGLTPRWVLQHMGTEAIRQKFHDDIWIASLEREMLNAPANYVISDVRFPNEIDMIHRLGGKIVFVQRGPAPPWTNHHYEDLNDLRHFMTKYFPQVHASEYNWYLCNIDRHIMNNGSLADLEKLISSVA